MKIVRLLFLIVAVLFLSSCEKKEATKNNQIQDEVELFKKKESQDSFWEKSYHQLYLDNLAQKDFFNLFFEQRQNIDFSLDEEILIYAFRGQCTVLMAGKDNCELFLYTRNRFQNKVWSNRCGVMEFLTQEQSKKIESIESELTQESGNLQEIQKSNFALFHWAGKNRFLYGKNAGSRFEYFSRGDDWLKADVKMFEFFKNEVFIHGCKKHLL